MSSSCGFVEVTEAPGIRASAEQLSMIYTRYNLARRYSSGKKVLEVACGTGIGLPYLAQVAEQVVGGDIDPENVRIAKLTAGAVKNVDVLEQDAHSLKFSDNQFDVVILFEAIYYIEDVVKFMSEVRRVLNKGGVLVISTVNCKWSAFNPSPFSKNYYGLSELGELFSKTLFDSEYFVAYPQMRNTLWDKIIHSLKRVAVSVNLIPKTMKGKEILKRIFFGELRGIPKSVCDGMADIEPLRSVEIGNAQLDYKMIYCVARPL